MKHFVALWALFCVPFLASSAYSQVLDVNDPLVVYDPDNPPAVPANGVLADWVYTPELNWNSSKWKSYILDGIAFRLRFPNNYNPNRAEEYPMIVIIHGIGYRDGTLYLNDRHLNNSGAKAYEDAINANKFDGFVLSPQSTNPWFTEYHMDVIDRFIDRAAEQVNLDANRVSINGRSGGAQKVWEFIQRHPKTYASAAPMSGVTSYSTNNIDAYKHMPIWLFQGGLDNGPTPFTTEGAIDKIIAKGGNVTYTKYKKGGHGIFNTGYAEPDYFPFFSRVHKANPTVLQGTYASVYDDENKVIFQYIPETQPCPGDAISIKMGLTAGFEAYQWRKNGTLISGATQHEYTATSLGTYEARFRRGDRWSDWSPRPVVIKEQAATQTPDIQIVGLASRALPTLDARTSVPLELPQGFASYEWRRVSDDQVVSTERVFEATQPGQYVAQVTENLGCSSSPSLPFTVVNANGPNKPAVPSDFKGVATSQTDIRLSWSATGSPSATGYELYRSTSATGGFTFVALVDNATQWVDSGLAPDSKYYYRLRAVNATGASASTSPQEVSTQADRQAPTAPTNLVITEATPSSVTLDWNEATDDTEVTRYDVYRNGTKVLSVEASRATVYNLQANTAYTFRVKARDQAGNESAFSNQVSTTPGQAGEAAIILPLDNTLTDVSANATQAKAQGTIGYSSSDKVEGSASLSLSGNGAYVDLDRGDQFVHKKLAERTVAFWLKSNSDQGVQDVFDEGGNANGFGIRRNGATLEFAVRNAKVQRTLSAPLAKGRWYHVAAVYQSGTITLYVDGAPVATDTNVPFTQINSHGSGAGLGGTNGSNAFNQKSGSLDGLIDDFRLFTEALSEEQVARLADSDSTPPPTGGNKNTVSINFNASNPQAAPWNNTNTIPDPGLVFSNLKDEQGNGTGISFEIVAANPEYDPSQYGFSGDNPFGMVTGDNSGVVPDNVMRSTYWMDPGKVAELRFFGLDLSQQYSFRFFASRDGGGNRTSVYRINGKSVKLNAAGNTDNIVQIDNIVPNNDGEVVVSITSDAGASFSYLGAIIIESSPAPATRTAKPVAKATPEPDELIVDRQVTVYPNPYDGIAPLRIQLEGNRDEVVTVQIFDLLGSLVYEKRSDALAERAELMVEWPAAQGSGVYMMYVSGNQSGTYTQRLLKE